MKEVWCGGQAYPFGLKRENRKELDAMVDVDSQVLPNTICLGLVVDQVHLPSLSEPDGEDRLDTLAPWNCMPVFHAVSATLSENLAHLLTDVGVLGLQTLVHCPASTVPSFRVGCQ